MVHLQMNGFIADNLYQYVIARLIAEELGFQLEVSSVTAMQSQWTMPPTNPTLHLMAFTLI